MSYGALSSKEVLDTLYRLRNRINERFPGCGLFKVTDQIVDLLKEAQDRSKWVKKDLAVIKIPLIAIFLLFPVLIVAAFIILNLDIRLFSVGDILDCVQTVLLYVVFVWACFYYLRRVETRRKRRKVFKIFHKVRHIAHVIEMHRLNKDPTRVVTEGKDTPSSPTRLKDPFLIDRYNAYCKELLILLGKVPALYSQHFDDREVLAYVTDLELLCQKR